MRKYTSFAVGLFLLYVAFETSAKPSNLSFNGVEALPPKQSGTAVVFDAGSSGTRVYIYNWELDPLKSSIPVISLPQGQTRKGDPGIANFADSIEKISDHLNPLVNFAKEKVGIKNVSNTPLFFAGTAGLRLLEQRNPKGYRAVIAKTKEILEKSGFKIKRPPGIISGQEEAVFAWINVNALENRLSKIVQGTDFGIGIAEMGGASFQVAFLPKTSLPAESYTVNFAGHPITLYAYSYGDLGENEGRAKFSNIEFCEWDRDYKNLTKAGNFDKCRKAIIDKIIEVEGKECESCGIGKIFQPKLDEITEEFYGLGALGFLATNFGVGLINAQNLREQGLKICNVPFNDAKVEMRAFRDNIDLMKKQCFNLAYYSAVLSGNEKSDENGIGFPADTTKLVSKNKINNQEVTWTYGLLMHSLLTKE